MQTYGLRVWRGFVVVCFYFTLFFPCVSAFEHKTGAAILKRLSPLSFKHLTLLLCSRWLTRQCGRRSQALTGSPVMRNDVGVSGGIVQIIPELSYIIQISFFILPLLFNPLSSPCPLARAPSLQTNHISIPSMFQWHRLSSEGRLLGLEWEGGEWRWRRGRGGKSAIRTKQSPGGWSDKNVEFCMRTDRFWFS